MSTRLSWQATVLALVAFTAGLLTVPLASHAAHPAVSHAQPTADAVVAPVHAADALPAEIAPGVAQGLVVVRSHD